MNHDTTADNVIHSHRTSDISVLRAENITKKYQERPILRGISLNIKSGEVVALLGPNGAGKTTAFYMITGLIQPDSGQIFLNDTDITPYPIYHRANMGIGYLPQESSIFRGLNTQDNILAVAEMFEKNPRIAMENTEKLMEEFSITHLRKTPSIALSGGERRRVEIARALATNPKFLLLDEPFAGVDPISVGDIRQLVTHLTKRGLGVLITDHNVRETLDIIDRAYILYDGTILMSGTKYDILNDQKVRDLYLGQDFYYKEPS